MKHSFFTSWAFMVLAIMSLNYSPTVSASSPSTEIGCVSTTFHLTSPNDKICVKTFSDPELPGITCYISRAITGGWSGAVGIAEDPSRFSLSCMQTGSVDSSHLNQEPTDVFKDSASFFSKTINVKRMYDPSKKVIIYLVFSTKIVDGSPMNSIATVQLH